MKHINCLPDLCMLEIFDLIPLDDLTRIGRVCHRWHSLEKSAYARVRTLDLFVYEEEPRPNFRPGIQLKSYRNSATINFIDRFPNVSSLSIEVEDESCSIDGLALANLFTHHWSSKLIELKLTEIVLRSDSTTEALVKAINNLPSLKSLLIMADIESHNYTFPIVAQLEVFECNLKVDINWLKKYAEGNVSLRQLDIQLNSKLNNQTVEALLKLSPQFASKFTGINAEDHLDIDNSLLARFCMHFTSLQQIKLLVKTNFVKCLSCLTPLKLLDTLYLFFWADLEIEGISQQLKISPLESVNTLKVMLCHSPDEAIELMSSINFAHLFPKIEICLLDWLYQDDFDTEKHANEHFHNMIKSLKICEQLSSIEYCSYEHVFKWARD